MTSTELSPPIPTKLSGTPGQIGSSYQSIHTAPGLQTALRTIPSWTEAARRLHALDDMTLEPPSRTAGAALADLIHEAIATDAPVPDDLAEHASRLLAADTGHILARETLASVRGQVVTDLDTAFVSNVDQVLVDLNGQLQDVVEQVSGIKNRREVATLEAAVDADRIEDHRRLQDLTGTYAVIRGCQLNVMKRAVFDNDFGGSASGRPPEALIFADPLAVWPNLEVWRYFGPKHPKTYERLQPPWPYTAGGGSGSDAMVNLTAILGWACDHDAALRVPTTAQYAETVERLTTNRRAAVAEYETRSSAPPMASGAIGVYGKGPVGQAARARRDAREGRGA